ncbi:MAG: anhydro-N-acetylmuramic acid kinase [Succinivibrio sp.]|nr:anhydro-N-acetylmuramic acid kinase [Succinivibrio sp.]
MQPNICIGLMSGTSIDALDGVAVEFSKGKMNILGQVSIAWPDEVKKTLHSLCNDNLHEIETAGCMANEVARTSAKLVQILLDRLNLKKENILAIGSHGQTIRHRPAKGFSVQLDNGPLLAALTGIDTIVNFRMADIAHGGEGAPLTPAFHKEVFGCPERCRMILNLGGISNITVISKDRDVLAGFDCGPANTLMDLVCRKFLHQPYDKDAQTASQGKVNEVWLNKLLSHEYLKKRPPKSTGREDFNEELIHSMLEECTFFREKTADLLRTLCEFTVRAVTDSIRDFNLTAGQNADLILCGGGAFNPLVRMRFEQILTPLGIKVLKSSDFGVSETLLEAQAFAFFAYRFVEGICSDLCTSTGQKSPAILGCLCPATDGYFAKTARHSCLN